jgi:hypothetical protein
LTAGKKFITGKMALILFRNIFMKLNSFIAVFFLLSFAAAAQDRSGEIDLPARLDSLSHSNGAESHFAAIYSIVTDSIEDFTHSLPPLQRELIKRLELSFAGYYLRAVDAYHDGGTIPAEWLNYFTSRGLSNVQMTLLGVNAHINCDIWQALSGNFTAEELKILRPVYKKYYRLLSPMYAGLYRQAFDAHRKIRQIHFLTFGFGRQYGKLMLKKWRNRQYRLAIYYFEEPEKFSRLKNRVYNKKQRIDRMITRKLK